MPPSSLDLVRARITRLLNETAVASALRPPRKQVAIDDGRRITYTAGSRTFEITVKEVED